MTTWGRAGTPTVTHSSQGIRVRLPTAPLQFGGGVVGTPDYLAMASVLVRYADE